MIPEYPWLRLVGVRKGKLGERILSESGCICAIVCAETERLCVIVEPANAYNVLRLEDLKIPEGHEPDGESLKDAFRQINEDADTWLGVDGKAHSKEICAESLAGDNQCGDPVEYEARRLCLRKIAPKTVQVLVIEWYNPPSLILKAWTADTADMAGRSVRVENRPI